MTELTEISKKDVGVYKKSSNLNRVFFRTRRPKVNKNKETKLSKDIKESEELDENDLMEISKQRLGAYIKKAVSNIPSHVDKNKRDSRIKNIALATKKNPLHDPEKHGHTGVKVYAKESVELDEVSVSLINRYMNKASRQHNTGEKDRGSGIDLALKKKYGNKKYGIPEPKVKATESEELTMDKTQLLEAIINKEPVTFKSFISALLEEKAESTVDAYIDSMYSSELTEEELEDILNELSEDDFEALMDEVLEDLTEEDLEELDEDDLMEISKQRLGSYIKKSIKDKEDRTKAVHNSGGITTDFNGDETISGSKKAFVVVSRKQKNRTKGINKAVDKLTKESEDLEEGKALPKMKDQYSKKDDSKKKISWRNIRKTVNKKKYDMDESEQLDEISKERLHQYVLRASGKNIDHILNGNRAAHDEKNQIKANKEYRNSGKRWTGMNKALHKMRASSDVKVPAKD